MAWNGILYYNISAETSKEVKSTNDLRGQYNGKRTYRIEFKTRNVYRVQNFLDEWFSLSLKFFIYLKGFFSYKVRFLFHTTHQILLRTTCIANHGVHTMADEIIYVYNQGWIFITANSVLSRWSSWGQFY